MTARSLLPTEHSLEWQLIRFALWLKGSGGLDPVWLGRC